jgi:hypothetical protein
MIIVVGLLVASVIFCLSQFIHLMRRGDDEFPGRFDKPIWAAAIIFGTVLGAFAYWLSKPREAPESSASLESEFASAIKKRPAGSGGSTNAG